MGGHRLMAPLASGDRVEQQQQEAAQFVEARLGELDLPFQVPTVELLGTLWQ